MGLQWFYVLEIIKTALDLFIVGVSSDTGVKLAVNFSNVLVLDRTGALKNGCWNIYVYLGWGRGLNHVLWILFVTLLFSVVFLHAKPSCGRDWGGKEKLPEAFLAWQCKHLKNVWMGLFASSWCNSCCLLFSGVNTEGENTLWHRWVMLLVLWKRLIDFCLFFAFFISLVV